MRFLIPALIFVPLQDSTFSEPLEKAERLGFAHPDLAVALEALKPAADSAPKELRDRYLSLQARAAVLEILHPRLVKAVGSTFPFPFPGGKTEALKVVSVGRDAVKVEQMGGQREIRFADLDAAWMAATVREDVRKRPDGSLLLGLFLAAAGRWPEAFRELGAIVSDHPLAVEARRRGLERVIETYDGALKRRQWAEAFAAVAVMEANAAEASLIAASRKRIREGIVAHGIELARVQKKADMESAIALLVKHFPDAAEDAARIRSWLRWIQVTDPAALGLTGEKGKAWTMNPESKPVHRETLKPPAGAFDGFSARFRFDDPSGAHAGILWDHVAGRQPFQVYVSMESTYGFVARLDEKDPKKPAWVPVAERELGKAEGYVLSAFIIKGEYVVTINGHEMGRFKTPHASLTGLAVQASWGRAYIDQVWLRKRE